jgi:hypothetical protein
MQDMNYEELQLWSQQFYSCDYPEGLRIATGIDADPSDICQALFNKELSACYEELLGTGAQGTGGVLNSRALLLDGSSGCWCTTPDAVALDIVGDIDIRAEGILINPPLGVSQTFVSKWNGTGNQRSYLIQLSNIGIWRILWTTGGITSIADTGNAQSATGNVRAFRKTLDVVDGTNRTIKSYFGNTLDQLTTEFSTESPAGNTSIFSGTAELGVGAHTAGTADRFSGRINRVQVRNSINGTIVANPDFRSLAPGTTNFVDSAGLTWTLQGTAKIV